MRQRDNDFLEPDLTPLIDVVFILLIFFLVTSVFKKQELTLLLNLPDSKASETLSIDQTKDVIIEIKEEKLVVSGKEINLNELAGALSGKDVKNTIHIRSDKETRYYRVIEVLDVLKSNNITNINLVTQKPQIITES